MKKGLIVVIILALVGLGTFAYINLNNNDVVENETADNMKDDDMASDEMKDDDMSEDEEMKDDDMSTDEMKDDMIDDHKDDEMMDDDKETVEIQNAGDAAPQFELTSLDGESVLLEDLVGEKVYLKFWASWCHICLEGLPDLDDLSTQDTDYKVITIVSPGHNGERETEDFKEWFDRQGHENLTVLLDETGEVTREYAVRGYPTSAFVGSDGILVRSLPGHLDNEVITQFFESIY